MNRIKEWSEQQITYYYLGIRHSDYPEVFWQKMKPVIKNYKTLIDIGCGPGAFALKAAESGFQVQAVDISKKNLDALKMQVKLLRLNNVNTIPGDWVDVQVEKNDVSVCAYSFGDTIGTLEGIKKIIDLTNEVAFFITPYETLQTDFLSEKLYHKSGIEPPSFKGNYQDILNIFNYLHEDVSLETVEYDFGMPLNSKEELNSCAVYLGEKLGIPSVGLVEEHLQKIAGRKKNGMYWVPNPRKSTMITWRRGDKWDD